MRRAANVVAITLILLATHVNSTANAQAQVSPPAAVQALAGQHPAEYYQRAAGLFKDGKRDDAVFVFYLGQLRYRVHLIARRDTLPPSGDPALFSSLSEIVGRPINEYAFGDIPALARTIDAVLAWDAANPDRFTPPAQFTEAHADIRAGLLSMKNEIVAEAESIRAQRLKNGLENRK